MLKKVNTLNHLVIGIGVSAEETCDLESFFATFPDNTGFSFIVTGNFTPDQDVSLNELLGKRSRLPVKLIEDEDTILPDHIYITPIGNEVTLSGEKFILRAALSNGLNRSSDRLFSSLAKNFRERAVVLLLGSFYGSGSEKEITNSGALFFVREPSGERIVQGTGKVTDPTCLERIFRMEDLPGLLLDHQTNVLTDRVNPTNPGNHLVNPENPDEDRKEGYIRYLEQELLETRANMRTVIDELEKSNNELKSANTEASTALRELKKQTSELMASKEELRNKIAEAELINNDLKNLLQSTGVGILILDKKLHLRLYTDHINEVARIGPSDIGKALHELDIKFSAVQLAKDAMIVLENLSSVEKDLPSAGKKHYWLKILPYRTIEDKIEGVVISFTDISEKYRVNRLIRESEEWRRYKDLFDNMDLGIALFRAKGNRRSGTNDFRLLEANIAFSQMLGISEIDRRKNASVIFTDPVFRKTFINAAVKALTESGSQEEWHAAETDSYYRILFFSQQVPFVAAIVQDITRDKQELKAQDQIASIVKSSDDAIYSESPEGKILSWNEGAAQLYGYRETEAIGSAAADLGLHAGEDRELIHRVKKGEKISNRETIHRRKDGTFVPVSVSICPIKDKNGLIVAISNIVKDITHVKVREKELVKAKEETEQAAGMKALFLSNMSHEIRTPLNAILGFTDMLKDEVKGAKSKKYVNNIYYSGIQLLHLINDIVDISRLDAGKLPLNLSSVNLVSLLEKAREQFEGYAVSNRKYNIDFSLKLPVNEEKRFIVTDEYRLQQILQNLLSNAFKFTEKGSIEFGYEVSDGNTILFYVSDTGPGINPQYHDKIFERFEQVGEDPGRNEKIIRGTGLGLAIARGLAERLGGRMWVESEMLQGSTFYFTIPYEEGEETQPLTWTTDVAIKVPQLAGKRILIADDDPYSLEMLKFMLRDTDVRLFIAKDGQEVLDHFHAEKLEMILLDIRMPKKDGFEIIREIRAAGTEIPVIAQSAFALPEQIRKSKAMGFDDYLVKPVSKESLYRVLEKYLKEDKK